MRARNAILAVLGLAATGFFLASCDTNKLAVRAVADALASSGSGGSSGSAFTRDDDPILVADALPTFIKTLELVLDQVPDHDGLCLTTGSVIIMYASAFVMDRASMLGDEEIDKKDSEYKRAKSLFLRGRDYILRALEHRHPGFLQALLDGNEKGSVGRCGKEDMDYLYWATLGWVAAFSADTFDFELQFTVPKAERMMARVAELDSGYASGAAWDFYASYYAGVPESMGGDRAKAKEAWKKGFAYNKGQTPGPWLTYALTFSLPEGNKEEFRDCLNKALAIDVNAHPESRLQSVLAQQKARWYLDRIDSLFPKR
jgi:predicted anti-sigma-YlaC factor YlaD